MKVKTWLPICLALVLGVIAAKLAKDSMSSRKGPATSVKLVVAKRAITPGESLSAADLEVRPIAAEALPEGAHSDASRLVGRTARADLVKGQPVLESLLAAAGAASGLQALVPPGMRAMTIEINEFSGVGGMVMPGSRVDVLATMRDPANDEAMSRTIAQNVIVKAVGKTTGTVTQPGEAGGEPVKSVTLLVSSKQAEAIQLGGIVGKPWLVLRGSEDNGIAPTGGTTLAELRGTAAGVSSNLLAILRNVRASAPARDTFAAHVPPPAGSPGGEAAPATQPTAAPQPTWAPSRAIHTIRNTVENTVSVTPSRPTTGGGDGGFLTGAPIEP